MNEVFLILLGAALLFASNYSAADHGLQAGSVGFEESAPGSASVSVGLHAFRRPAGLGTPHVGTPRRGSTTYCSRIQPTMMPIKR